MQNLSNVTMTELDNSNGVLFICYDPDTQMVYLCGKVVTVFLYCWNLQRSSVLLPYLIVLALILHSSHFYDQYFCCIPFCLLSKITAAAAGYLNIQVLVWFCCCLTAEWICFIQAVMKVTVDDIRLLLIVTYTYDKMIFQILLLL